MGKSSKAFDILITGGILLTMNDNMDVLENCALGVKDDVIVLVDTIKSSYEFPESEKSIDATDCIVLPGLINTHTHAPMVCFRGYADDLPLMTWLNDFIFPLERKFVDREMVYWGSLLAAAEMIASGTTTFCDGYFYESSVMEAALAAGIRVVGGMGIIDTDFRTNNKKETERHIDAAKRFIKKWLCVSDLVWPALFCHAPYTCSEATLRSVKRVAREADILFITHLAETKDESEIVRNVFGTTPTRYLEKIGVLDDRTLVIHCNWLDNEEIGILSSNNVGVSHNAESNMKLATGIAPVVKMLKEGITVSLGTDGCASNNNLDMFGEMGTVARAHKLLMNDAAVMDARTVLKLATINGAKALGLEKLIGSIEVGKKADIIIVDTRKPRLTPLYDPYSQLVYAATGDDVITTIVNGKIVMEDRKILTFNVEEAMNGVNRIAKNIRDHRTSIKIPR